jgi:regulatory protein
MKTVTAIKSQRHGNRRVNVFLDGAFAFSLEIDVAQKAGLREGKLLSSSEIDELTAADASQRCFNAALDYLSYRPRSESELKMRLHRRGFDDGTIESILPRLRELRLIDDQAFAQFWRDNRESFSPRSRRLLRLELRRKGIDADVIDEVAQGIDEDASAYRAAQKKAQTLRGCDYQTFYRKLGSYLRRRGFDYGLVKQTLDRVWQEAGSI